MMKKNQYVTPCLEFVAMQPEEDILSGSFEVPEDTYREDYGVMFPF